MSGSPQGFFEYAGELTPLQTRVEFMEFCAHCDSEQIFVAAWDCQAGLVGCCIGCGDERIAPFTRAISEAQ